MFANQILIAPNEDQISKVYDELGETEDKLNNRIDLFENWMKTKSYLPKNINSNLIQNFIRLSKFDILKARAKFEQLCIAKAKCDYLFDYTKIFKENVLVNSPIHRTVAVSKRLTKEGYRIVIIKCTDITYEYFNSDHMLSYGLLLIEYLLWHTIQSAIIFIFDCTYFSVNVMSKINLSHLKRTFQIMLNVMPIRINNVYVLNMPPVAQMLLNVVKSLLSEKINNRMHFRRNMDLANIIEVEALPEDYGGKSESVTVLGDEMRDFLSENHHFVEAMSQMKANLSELPADVNADTWDSELDGSFRSLNVD